jgi:squalene-hopene/tetraprenyl-beta-curcumene cyclase
MSSRSNVRIFVTDGLATNGLEDAPDPWCGMDRSPPAELASPLRRAIVRTRQWLLSEQQPEGYWVGELEGDSILQSEYLLLLAFLGQEAGPVARKVAQRLVDTQRAEGGWSLYPGAGVEISASVKAYFALKLVGHDPSAEYMQRARAAILAGGGADAVNSFTRFYLALLGQISYDQCPEVPPEVMLAPRWFPINLYAVSAWSRTIIVPLSIISALRPVTTIEPGHGIRELFLRRPEDWPPLRCPGRAARTGLLSWDRFFRTVDAVLKSVRQRGWLPLRKRAMRAAEAWVIERFERSDGLGAIFPPMVWSIIALTALGYAEDSPELKYCHERLQGLFLEDERSIRLQPCKSPVWDTAIAARSLSAAGVSPEHESLRAAIDWLLARQISRPGDWSATVRAQPGGWCFEHANDFYPDLDDTAMALMALAEEFRPRPDRCLSADLTLCAATPAAAESNATRDEQLSRMTCAIERGERWMLAMQNRDGGWGAFDRDNDRDFLCHVPFADHNAMIDPSTPDLTARVLEALGRLGHRVGAPAVDRAVRYLRETQEADGSWFGRWGVNYLYGAWQALAGLAEVGVATDDPAIAAGAEWLICHQQPSGGWGESADSYARPHLRGQGPATASQTSWALLGLMAAGRHDHPAVARGVRYLIDHQRPDGGWDEPEFTGTGFPLVFYLRYHLYPIYFPLLALARYAAHGVRITGAALRVAEETQETADVSV